MANELTLNLRLDYSKSGSVLAFEPAVNLSRDITATTLAKLTHNVQNTEEVLDLGPNATTGYLCGINRDAAITITIRPGTGENGLVELGPGDVCLFKVSADATAPYIIGSSSDALFEYVLLPAST